MKIKANYRLKADKPGLDEKAKQDLFEEIKKARSLSQLMELLDPFYTYKPQTSYKYYEKAVEDFKDKIKTACMRCEFPIQVDISQALEVAIDKILKNLKIDNALDNDMQILRNKFKELM